MKFQAKLQRLVSRSSSVPDNLLSTTLQEHPWRWPADAGLARALREMSFAPSPLDPGQGMLLAWSTRGTLWQLRVGDTTRSAQAVQIGARALQAMRHARIAAADALPLMVHPLPKAFSVAPLGPIGGSVDGDSFGLMMALCLGSYALGVPLPEDLTATAALDSRGELRPVQRVREKLIAITQDAPRISRVLVADGEVPEDVAAWAEETGLDVIQVATVADAFGIAFDDATLESIIPTHPNPEGLADGLLRMTLRGHGAAIRWTPVVAVCDALRGRVEDPARLDFVRAVAARHAGWDAPHHLEVSSIIGTRWFEALPRYARRAVIANVLQHSTDWGVPDPTETVELAEDWVGGLTPITAELDELKVMGAYGRLLVLCGRYDDALTQLRKAIAGWRLSDTPAQMSFPVCTLVRVASMTGREEIFSEAWPHILEAGIEENPFVRFEVARGRVTLAASDVLDMKGPQALERLIEGRNEAPSFLRLSALRWLIRVRRSDDELRRELAESRDKLAPLFQALVALDDAVYAGDLRAQEVAIHAVGGETHPHWVERLIAGAAELGESRGERLAKAFPY